MPFVPINFDTFLGRANTRFGNKFNYDSALVVYKNISTRIPIVCPSHGEFWQKPYSHLNQVHGCPRCGDEGTSKGLKFTTEEFVLRSHTVHHNIYDYSESNYVDRYTQVKIRCKKHGEFYQAPINHLQGCGCPKCMRSKGEEAISQWLDKRHTTYETQVCFEDLWDKGLLRFDFKVFYSLTDWFLLEYDGQQHFIPTAFRGSNESFKDRKRRDDLKTQYCSRKSFQLHRISYKENIEERLDNLLLTVYDYGKLLKDYSFDEVRANAQKGE